MVICDRCGEKIDCSRHFYPSFKVKKYVNQWTPNKGNVSGWRTIKLCPRCYKGLEEFLCANDEYNYEGAPDWTNGGCDTGGF